MATEIVATLRIDGLEQVNQTLGQVEQKIGNVQQAATNVGTNTGIPKLNTDTTNAVKTLDNFEKKLGSTINVSRSAQGVARLLGGSIELATSAFAAFGVENEEVSKTLLRVQAAASFSQGIRDLARGFNALNISGIALNKTLLANPFVLIGTLVATLITSFVGFNEIISLITETAKAAFAPFQALFGSFSEGSEDIDKAAQSLENYNKQLRISKNESADRILEIEAEIEILRIKGATEEEISLKKRQLLTAEIRAAEKANETERNLLDDLRVQRKQTDVATEEGKKQIEKLDKEIFEAEQRRNETFQRIKKADIELIKFDTDFKENQREKEKAANEKAIEDAKRLSDERKNQLEKERQDTIKNLQERLKQEGDLVKENNLKELDVLKNRLLNREITEETFNAERRLLEIKLNEELVKVREKFAITEKEQKTIGAEETKKINEQINKEIIDAEREAAKNRVEVIEKDYLRKKQQLLDISANDETITQEQLNIELQKLEIEKNENLLTQLEVGSKEYLILQNQIQEQRIKLEKDTNNILLKEQQEYTKKQQEDLKLLLDVVTITAKGIETIVQEVSPLFESVGQTTLETFEKITSGVPELIKTLTDKTLSEQERLAAGIGFIGSSIGQITEIIQKDAEVRLEQIDKEEEERIASLERQKEAGLITEQELSVGKTQIQNEFLKKRREAEKKAFEQEKAIRIVQAVAQTAQAVLNAFSSGSALGGPPVGAVFAGIAAAFGAAQIGIISAQKFPEQGGGGGSSSVPSVSTPSLAAEGSITPTTFNPQTFGTGVGQEQTFGNSNIVGETTSGVGGGGSQSGGLVLRAYVVESDIASTTNRLSSIREASEL